MSGFWGPAVMSYISKGLSPYVGGGSCIIGLIPFLARWRNKGPSQVLF